MVKVALICRCGDDSCCLHLPRRRRPSTLSSTVPKKSSQKQYLRTWVHLPSVQSAVSRESNRFSKRRHSSKEKPHTKKSRAKKNDVSRRRFYPFIYPSAPGNGN
ncbi:hypothetical protein CEXT_601521 [Caerostris extrusa]|uniref:Uncharacterized protein n=1 Tax=Caerostris extrusa TaxID=172846 RepID=A0AAV4SSQ7_CAEEX|nr:hypothetical protein CEXT_601521 [Caerostris extrusa]